MALGSITGDFVPHLSITVAEALLPVDLGVLIYFIHHIAKSIQLPEVIAGIARDLTRAIGRISPARTGRRQRNQEESRSVCRRIVATFRRARRHGSLEH